MKINLNFAILILFSFVALILNYLSQGDISGIGSDFSFYFNRLVFIRDYNIPLNQWFSNSLQFSPDMDIERVSNFVPSPFYTLIFLGPLFIHGSNFLFALQGILISFLIFRIIRKFIGQIYFFLNDKILNLILILGSLNPAFLKDSLTSGPVSICNLFLLYGFFYRDKTILASILFSCAAMTRSNYIIYWLAILIASLIGGLDWFKKFFKISFLSLIVYFIFYFFFYSSHPGSEISFAFTSGLPNMAFYDNYFSEALSKYFDVSNSYEIANLQITYTKFLKLVFTDFKIAYGLFLSWIFKILSSLGFLHSHLLNDWRSIYWQRLTTLLYFIFVMAPSFILSCFSLVSVPKLNKKFWLKKEYVILSFAVIFLLMHSIIMGIPRYMTGVAWIFVAFYIRLIFWFRKITAKSINS